MLIDCDTCGNRGAGCSGCLVTALLDSDPADLRPGRAPGDRGVRAGRVRGGGAAVGAVPRRRRRCPAAPAVVAGLPDAAPPGFRLPLKERRPGVGRSP